MWLTFFFLLFFSSKTQVSLPFPLKPFPEYYRLKRDRVKNFNHFPDISSRVTRKSPFNPKGPFREPKAAGSPDHFRKP